MADNRITKHRVKNHWAYSWWKYLLMTICVVFGVNLFFTTTAYRPPENRKVEIYLCSGWADAEAAQADLLPVLMELAPEQEELQVANIDLLGDDYYTNIQFTTYMAAQQGDILLLPKGEFAKYAADEVYSYFAELTPYMEAGLLNAGDRDLSGMTFANASDEAGVFGIPGDLLYGLVDYGIDPADTVLVITAYSGNEETCVKMVNAMLARYSTEKPENYDEWHNRKKNGGTSATQIYF